jgi:hypothetical protein
MTLKALGEAKVREIDGAPKIRETGAIRTLEATRKPWSNHVEQERNPEILQSVQLQMSVADSTFKRANNSTKRADCPTDAARRSILTRPARDGGWGST